MYCCWRTGCVFSAVYRNSTVWLPSFGNRNTNYMAWMAKRRTISVQNISKHCYGICNTPINLEVRFGILNKEICRQYVYIDQYYTQHRWLISQCLSATTAHCDIFSKVNRTSRGRKNTHWKFLNFTHPATDTAAWAVIQKYLCVCVYM